MNPEPIKGAETSGRPVYVIISGSSAGLFTKGLCDECPRRNQADHSVRAGSPLRSVHSSCVISSLRLEQEPSLGD